VWEGGGGGGGGIVTSPCGQSTPANLKLCSKIRHQRITMAHSQR
jgi:hypothetical protein